MTFALPSAFHYVVAGMLVVSTADSVYVGHIWWALASAIFLVLNLLIGVAKDRGLI